MGLRHIYENSGTVLFELERFRVRSQSNFSQELRAARVENRDRSVAIPDVDPLRLRIIPHIVGVVLQIDDADRMEVSSLKDSYFAAGVVGDDEPIRLRDVSNSLGCAQTFD